MVSGRRRGVVVAAVLVVAAVAVGLFALSRSGGDERVDVAVVGDSFARQSTQQLRVLAEERDLDLVIDAYDGSALCDWSDRLAELRRDPPRRLVLSFAGNDLTSCMNASCDAGPDSCDKREPDVVAGIYREQIDELVRGFEGTGTEVFVVLPPPVGDAGFEAGAAAMRTMYRQLHDDDPAVGVIDSATTLDPEGVGWAPVLPCEDWDAECPPSGEIEVRNEEDLIHFTPAGGERYARAILDALA